MTAAANVGYYGTRRNYFSLQCRGTFISLIVVPFLVVSGFTRPLIMTRKLASLRRRRLSSAKPQHLNKHCGNPEGELKGESDASFEDEQNYLVGDYCSVIYCQGEGGLVSVGPREPVGYFYQDEDIVAIGPLTGWKKRLSSFLATPIIDVVVIVSALCSSLLVALSTLPDLPGLYSKAIRISLNVIGIVFVADFLGRWFASLKPRGKHVLRPQFAVDAVVGVLPMIFGFKPSSFWANTWLPEWLASPSGLINLKLLRVLSLQRVLEDMETFGRFKRALGISAKELMSKDWQLKLARVVLSLFTLLSVSTGLIYTAEHTVNPAITDYFTALYFDLITLTTVGYGDITPVTRQGKLVVCGSIIVGVAVIPAQAADLVEALLARAKAKDKTISRDKKIEGSFPEHMVLEMVKECHNCGSTLHWSSARYCYSCGEKL